MRLIGETPEFQSVLRAAQIVAATDASVLLLGESGTGKELLARAIHEDSPRVRRAFVALNCAALPESLAESELFGHSKGAFTGAHQRQQGKIPSADGGTLFLDEVGELSLAIQAKLLRFLESGECQVLGSNQTSHANVRVIAASNRDLAAEVNAGNFRADLYYRLNVVPLALPPLRERSSDVPLLLAAINQQLSLQYQLTAPSYNKAALTRLKNYPWPGNVRELRNFCERLLILCSGQTIAPSNLPAEFHRDSRQTSSDKLFSLPESGIHMDQVETDFIRQALEQTRGNQSKAAALLGISRDKLLYRIKKYALKI